MGRVSENAFGIMVQIWGVLLTTMHQHPINARLIVQACVCLHNLMRMWHGYLQNPFLDSEDADHNLVQGSWREAGFLQSLTKIKGGDRSTIYWVCSKENTSMSTS